MKTRALRKLADSVPTPEALVQEYNTLRFQMQALENRMRTCKNLLETHLERLPEQKAEIAGWLCTLARCERENFSLAKAREALKTTIFEKYIQPLVTKSEYTQIRVTPKAGAFGDKGDE